MFILLSNTSDEPLYEQIYNQLVQMICDQKLSADDPLPSIRQLAKDLKISVITVKRAYELLEDAGFIYTRQGVGCFVASAGNHLIRERLLNQAEQAFDEGIQYALKAGLLADEVITLFQTLLQMTKEDPS